MPTHVLIAVLANSVLQALQYAMTVLQEHIPAVAKEIVRNAQQVTLHQIKPQQMHVPSVHSTSIRIKKDNQIVLHALQDVLHQLKEQMILHCVCLLKRTFTQDLHLLVLLSLYSWSTLYMVDITVLHSSGSSE